MLVGGLLHLQFLKHMLSVEKFRVGLKASIKKLWCDGNTWT